MASSPYVTDDCLIDTSWSLHRITNLNWPGQNLRDPKALTKPARDFESVLQKTARGGPGYDEEDSDRAGGYQNSTWKIIRADQQISSTTRGLLISVKYDRATYKAILLRRRQASSATGPNLPLLMMRMPISLSKRFIRFLGSDFSATILPFRLPTPTLCHVLESYLNTVCTLSSATNMPSYARETSQEALPIQVIKDLKVTFAFSAPVAPHLRSLDMDIPFDTLWRLIRLGLGFGEATNGTDRDQMGFTKRLAEHIDRTLGLKIPSSTLTGPLDPDHRNEEEHDLIRISRMACASLAIAGDGKIKLVGKFVEGIEDEEMRKRMKKANDDLLDALVARATEKD